MQPGTLAAVGLERYGKQSDQQSFWPIGNG